MIRMVNNYIHIICGGVPSLRLMAGFQYPITIDQLPIYNELFIYLQM